MREIQRERDFAHLEKTLNLSPLLLKKYLSLLRSQGILKPSRSSEKGRGYKLTSRGFEVLSAFEELKEYVLFKRAVDMPNSTIINSGRESTLALSEL